MQQSRRRRLRERFGPEYDRRIAEADDRRVVERELTDREKRHASFDLRTLSDAERARFAERWTVVQEQFVDRPGEAVVAAEELVHDVMRERGYPTEKFEQQAADLSVEHGHVVDGYRAGHDVRTRHEQAGVTTEELRQALQHYRAIFVSLTGIHEDPTAVAHTDRTDHVDRTEHAGHADPAVRTGHVEQGEHVERAGHVAPVDPAHNGSREVVDEQPRRTNS
jgi:hypothetical protein